LSGKVSHAADFFRVLARTFTEVQEIDASSFAAKIDSRFMRRHLIASRFVIESLGIYAVEEQRELATERRRIDDLLARCLSKKYGALLARYANRLLAGGVATRTARLYLRAAESFCNGVGADSTLPWRAEEAVRHLIKSPGHAASLARFMTHCREHEGWDVRLPPKPLWEKSSGKKTADQVKRLRKALQRTADTPDAELTTRDVARVLSLALGVPAAQLLRERAAGLVVQAGDGSVKITSEATIGTGDPLSRYARRWAALASREQKK
jgi:hypothetical protein